PAVARSRDADDFQRRAALCEALAVARGRARPDAARRALLLPLPARVPRTGARLAAPVDDRRIRGREAARRSGDVGRGLPVVLAWAPRRAAVVRTADRCRVRQDAGV